MESQIHGLLSLASFTWPNVFKVHRYYRMCQHCFFLLPNDSPLHVCTSCLSIHQLIDIWVIPTFYLLSIMLIWTFMYKFLCRHVFTSLDRDLQVELLGHMVTLRLIFWRNAKLFSKVATPFAILAVIYEGSDFPTSLSTLAIVFFILAILVVWRDLCFPNN